MKKLMAVLFLSLFAASFIVTGCGGKYSDVKAMNNEFTSLVEDYIADLDKVDNAKSAANAINQFADGMEDLWPKMQKLSEKYPELKDKSKIPDDLKESQQKADEMSKKMVSALMKMLPYMKDPEVRKAQERLGAIMGQK